MQASMMMQMGDGCPSRGLLSLRMPTRLVEYATGSDRSDSSSACHSLTDYCGLQHCLSLLCSSRALIVAARPGASQSVRQSVKVNQPTNQPCMLACLLACSLACLHPSVRVSQALTLP
eukprot:GHVU01208436.1.p1 GENE.GHVU01208436.1~~GHVU01208436.1.p1  ORF type:complete len:118 (-),score=1.25 GHVU01208436.1:321-674(-)